MVIPSGVVVVSVRIWNVQRRGSLHPRINQHLLKRVDRSVGVNQVVTIQNDRRIIDVRVKPDVMPGVLAQKPAEPFKEPADVFPLELGAFIPPPVVSPSSMCAGRIGFDTGLESRTLIR